MNSMQHHICMLLGSNIEPEDNLLQAVTLLQMQMTILQTSSVWESQAIGSSGPNFLNAAVLALTTLSFDRLKKEVFRPLEAQLGRVRTEDKNSPRTIDIDLILFNQQLVDLSLDRYAHIAVPVAEILPDYQLENGEYLKDLASSLTQKVPIWMRRDVSVAPFSTVFQKP